MNSAGGSFLFGVFLLSHLFFYYFFFPPSSSSSNITLGNFNLILACLEFWAVPHHAQLQWESRALLNFPAWHFISSWWAAAVSERGVGT